MFCERSEPLVVVFSLYKTSQLVRLICWQLAAPFVDPRLQLGAFRRGRRQAQIVLERSLGRLIIAQLAQRQADAILGWRTIWRLLGRKPVVRQGTAIVMQLVAHLPSIKIDRARVGDLG